MAFEFLFTRAHLQLSDLKRKMSKSKKYALVLIYCSLACLAMSESCTFEDCGSYKDHNGATTSQEAGVLRSDYLWGNSLIRPGIDELCQNSKFFGFPSTLYNLFLEEHNSQTVSLDVNRDNVEVVLSSVGNHNSSLSEDSGLFELSNGRTLSCSLHSGDVIHGKQPANDGNPDQEVTFSCDGHLRCENEGKFSFKKAEMEVPEPLDGSYPCVQISHHQLNWGQCNLYHPSVTSLSIKNTCNEFALIIYEPFSTDSQFYPCNFSEVLLGPGESVSLSLVFLPTKLGLSSAQFILQTNSGGFLVQAKGFGLESPYMIMPMEEFDVSSSGWWRKSISLLNPFDEAIQLEGVIVWVSVSVGNSSLLAKAICREEGHNASHRHGFLNVRKYLELDVRTGYGFSKMTLRPLSSWLIDPQGTGVIMDIAFQPNLDGQILGTVCLQLRRALVNERETLLIPLERKLFCKPTYKDTLDLVSASIEAVGVDKATRAVEFSVYVTNSGSDLLKIVKIFDIPENRKLLQIKYSKGLLLFPGSVTQVAVVMLQPLNVENDNSCKICILTNNTFNLQLEIPCQNFFHICRRQSLESYFLNQLHEITPMTQRTMPPSAVQLPEMAVADEYVLKNSRNQGTGGDVTAIDKSRVFFPVVPVGSHLSKLITVKNPSPEPVAVQIIMISSEEIVDNCSIPDGYLQPFSSFNVLHNDSDRPVGHGFSIGENAVTEAFIHPYGSVTLGSVVFRPSSRCEWRSSVLVRNNLSGVEWLSLLGFGGSLSLLLHEGSELMSKIDFDLNLSVPLNTSPPSTLANSEDAFCGCDKPFWKELLVTNNGDVSISVTGIYVSGTLCQSDGFRVHNCSGFSLEPGESTKLQVSYQTDFSLSVVEKDLELILAGSRLVMPMKATVPVFMLNSCRKSIFSFRVKISSIASFLAVSLVVGTMCFLMYHGMILGSLDESTDSEESSIADHSPKKGKVVLVSGPDFSLRLADGNETAVIGSDTKPESVKAENSDEVVHSQTRLVNPETSETVGLTVRTGKDKGRRRRKRKGGNLAGVGEGASSHSGASTPSSPLSPALILTAKEQQPSGACSPSGSRSLARHQHKKSPEIQTGPEKKTFEAEVSVKGSCSSSSSSQQQGEARKWVPSMLAGDARAPGRRKAEKEEDKYRYDIWGNHFWGVHLGEIENFVENEGDSFFTKEPGIFVT